MFYAPSVREPTDGLKYRVSLIPEVSGQDASVTSMQNRVFYPHCGLETSIGTSPTEV